MLNAIIRYFDLQSDRRSTDTQPQGASGDFAPVFPQYLAVSAGVVLDPFLRHYISTGTWQMDIGAVLGRVLFGLIIGIMILPAIYKRAFDPDKPILVQIAALMPIGVGWQSIFESVTKAAGV